MSKKLVKNTLIYYFLIILSSSGIICGKEKREQWQPPEKIMDSVGVKPGMIIGEAGAGKGYFTFYLAKRVGNKGKVYANDIAENSLNELEARAKREDIKNIEIVLGEAEDPLFPNQNLDMIIMVYVFHELKKPVKFLKNLEKYLNAEAPVIIIEKNTTKEQSHYPHFMTKEEILDTIQKTNFELIRTETFLPRDTIYILKVKN